MSHSSPRSMKRQLSFKRLSNIIRSPSSVTSSQSPVLKKKKFSLSRLGKSKSWPKGLGLPNLATLLKEKDFDGISTILRDPRSAQDAGLWFEAEYSMTGENCLHRLVKSRPPAPLVSLMLQRLKEYGIEDPELSVDDLGQTPLHHAAANCCSPQAVAVLVGSSDGRMSARAQDDTGRLPLHAAMRPYNLFNNSEEANLLLQNPAQIRATMRTTVAILVEVCPQALFVSDDKNRTPLDFARALDFDRDFPRWVGSIGQIAADAAQCRATTRNLATLEGLVIDVSEDLARLATDDDVSALTLPQSLTLPL